MTKKHIFIAVAVLAAVGVLGYVFSSDAGTFQGSIGGLSKAPAPRTRVAPAPSPALLNAQVQGGALAGGAAGQVDTTQLRAATLSLRVDAMTAGSVTLKLQDGNGAAADLPEGHRIQVYEHTPMFNPSVQNYSENSQIAGSDALPGSPMIQVVRSTRGYYTLATNFVPGKFYKARLVTPGALLHEVSFDPNRFPLSVVVSGVTPTVATITVKDANGNNVALPTNVNGVWYDYRLQAYNGARQVAASDWPADGSRGSSIVATQQTGVYTLTMPIQAGQPYSVRITSRIAPFIGDARFGR